jgi:hypothetical protein
MLATGGSLPPPNPASLSLCSARENPEYHPTQTDGDLCFLSQPACKFLGCRPSSVHPHLQPHPPRIHRAPQTATSRTRRTSSGWLPSTPHYAANRWRIVIVFSYPCEPIRLTSARRIPAGSVFHTPTNVCKSASIGDKQRQLGQPFCSAVRSQTSATSRQIIGCVDIIRGHGTESLATCHPPPDSTCPRGVGMAPGMAPGARHRASARRPASLGGARRPRGGPLRGHAGCCRRLRSPGSAPSGPRRRGPSSRRRLGW